MSGRPPFHQRLMIGACQKAVSKAPGVNQTEISKVSFQQLLIRLALG